jgi:hypothetical protein
MSVFSYITTTKPSDDELAKAAPLRAQVRQAVLKRYDIFQKESAVCTEAELSYWQIRALKTFLESEIAWWNANLELTVQQVNTRKTLYVEKLEGLNKDLQTNLKTALAALPPEKAHAILNKLTAAEGFVDLSGSPVPSVDLSGATASLDVSDLQQSIAPTETPLTTGTQKPRTWEDDISSAAKYAFAYIGTILYICLALRFAAFAANDLLYKPLSYRILAFVYTFIFAPILLPYYTYREISHWIWPKTDGPHFESIFPIKPYDPSEPLTFDKRVYGYADTPGIRGWIQTMRNNESADRLAVLQKSILPTLVAQRV